MICTPFQHLAPDGSVVTGYACGRRPARKRCSSCNVLGSLECDGCDRPLCAPCSVSPGKHPDRKLGSLDFCPACCRPVFVEWCNGDGATYKIPRPDLTPTTHRQLRRAAFRKWALAHPEKFRPLMKAAP